MSDNLPAEQKIESPSVHQERGKDVLPSFTRDQFLEIFKGFQRDLFREGYREFNIKGDRRTAFPK